MSALSVRGCCSGGSPHRGCRGKERRQGRNLAVGTGLHCGGPALCVLAAGFFYKQRSTPAWFYGQICLAETFPDAPPPGKPSSDLIRGADYWSPWWPYSWGFTALWGFLPPRPVKDLVWGTMVHRCQDDRHSNTLFDHLRLWVRTSHAIR